MNHKAVTTRCGTDSAFLPQHLVVAAARLCQPFFGLDATSVRIHPPAEVIVMPSVAILNFERPKRQAPP